MDFLSLGSVNSYVKAIDMQNKWQQKKSSGIFGADGTKTMSEWLEKQKQDAGRYPETLTGQEHGSDKNLVRIMTKYQNGEKLTPAEKQYIRKNDPETYRKIKAAEDEVRQYENELKRCRTKEEARKVRMNHAAVSLSRVNDIKNNPHIPEGKKLEYIMQEKRKNDDIERVSREFAEKGDFAALPDEAEYRKAEHEIREAERELLRGGSKDTDITETPENPASGNDVREAPVKAEENTDSGNKVKVRVMKKDLRPVRKEFKAVKKRRKTLYEAQNSDEARKIKRSKAKLAYVSAASQADAAIIGSVPKTDIKA